jgi:chemotaxis protein methyltransferase CheR
MKMTPFRNVRLSRKEFRLLGEFIQQEAGIKMPPVKKTMLEGRLQKRLRSLGMNSFSEYCNYLFSPEGIKQEVVQMLDVVTTHKTDFFREPVHFKYLTDTIIPELIASNGTGKRRPLGIWSAGCSTGEEPYTLAIVLSEFAERHKGFSFFILATDISVKALDKARLAIYHESKVEPVPHPLRKKYLLRSRDREKRLVRITPELRDIVHFRHLNFMSDDYGMREQMDIIFCRNVLIYFERPTQKRLINNFCRHISPGGYLFLGHSETLSGYDVPLMQSGPNIYRKAEQLGTEKCG